MYGPSSKVRAMSPGVTQEVMDWPYGTEPMRGRGMFAVGFVGVEVGPVDVEDEVDDPPQVPNAGWHPVPQ
jgi:hypothetical protein